MISEIASGRFLRLNCVRWNVPFFAEHGEREGEGDKESVWRERERGRGSGSGEEVGEGELPRVRPPPEECNVLKAKRIKGLSMECYIPYTFHFTLCYYSSYIVSKY